VCHLNLCIKKWGSPGSFRSKRPFISLNSSAFIENLSSSEGARARARAKHAKKWCAERMRNAIEWNHLKGAYYSFSETQLRALRNSLWRHFFFRSRNTLRHRREKAENISEIWLVEIARGVLLVFFIMNGRSLEEVSERYRYKISVKPRQKPRGVVVKILMFIARAILRYFSARLSCTHAQLCSRRRSQKTRKSIFLIPLYSKTDRISHSQKFRINS